MHPSRSIWLILLVSFVSMFIESASAQQQQQKPNILVIMADDIGYWNISAYNRSMMGYRTPNIDAVAGATSAKASGAGRAGRMFQLLFIVDLPTKWLLDRHMSADAPWGARITREHPSYWLGCVGAFLSCSMT